MERHEIIMLSISAAVVSMLILTRRQFVRIPNIALLIGSFVCFAFSSLLTVAEGFLLENILNFLEHTGYCLSAIFLALWCIGTFLKGWDTAGRQEK